MKNLSRSELLGASTAIALVGLPLMTRFAMAAGGADTDDVWTLQSALELERAAIEAYQKAAGTGLLSAPVIAVAQGFIADHTAHRDALATALRAAGAVPGERVAHLEHPKLASQTDILRFARAVEQKAAATYLSVIPELKNRKLAEVAGAILGVETTHVALLAQALGERAYPTGFVV